jgi:hypothetical protein
MKTTRQAPNLIGTTEWIGQRCFLQYQNFVRFSPLLSQARATMMLRSLALVFFILIAVVV